MKCLSCDKILSDKEATRKYSGTQEYIDLCNSCFSTIKDQIHFIEREDLSDVDDILNEDDILSYQE